MPDVRCAVDSCDRAARSRGWCQAHYDRWRTTGDVQADRPLKRAAGSAGECSAPGCSRPLASRDYCQMHYARWKRGGDVGEAIAQRRPAEPCAVEGCDTRARSGTSGQRLCPKHHARWKRHGLVDATPKVSVVPTGLRRIQLAVSGRDRSSCWPWTGPHNAKGYAMLGNHKVMHLSMEADGRPRPPAPANNALHSCDNKGCWNPGHLRWGTSADNARDYAQRWGYCRECPHCNPS